MKELKMCGKRELHVLFTRLARIIEAHGDDGDDFIDIEIEPIIERFIDEYYCDVEQQHIVTYLLVWFMQWRASRGQWAVPSAA
jgi:archaellum biogenesis protein FlaJ (TadC family)